MSAEGVLCIPTSIITAPSFTISDVTKFVYQWQLLVYLLFELFLLKFCGFAMANCYCSIGMFRVSRHKNTDRCTYNITTTERFQIQAFSFSFYIASFYQLTALFRMELQANRREVQAACVCIYRMKSIHIFRFILLIILSTEICFGNGNCTINPSTSSSSFKINCFHKSASLVLV